MGNPIDFKRNHSHKDFSQTAEILRFKTIIGNIFAFISIGLISYLKSG